MATFEVKVYKLEIEEHPNADALELAVVGDYRAIVPKGQFKTGDLGAYIPEAAIVPDWLIEEMGLTGRLAGKQKNRVKAIKLRGILSQGLVVPVPYKSFFGRSLPSLTTPITSYGGIEEGDDVTEKLGITKYEPPIPTHMNGEVFNAFGMTVKYDIENFKKYPIVFEEGEPVTFTEKIHGTWCCFGHHPDAPHHIVTSKGLSEKGLAFKLNDANATNLYVRALNATAPNEDGTGDNIINRAYTIFGQDTPFYILGEIYGKGVQDLAYGADKPSFRVFDIYIGEPGTGRYLDYAQFITMCLHLDIERVPVLYNGPFDKTIMEEYTTGMETISGTSANIREGIVIRPVYERTNPELGRVILKSVSEDYLLRKNGTEFN